LNCGFVWSFHAFILTEESIGAAFGFFSVYGRLQFFAIVKRVLHIVFSHHWKPEKGLPFADSSTFEITMKTIIASSCGRENDLHANTLESNKIRAKASVKLPQEKLLTCILFAV
jgi:hypothetical protein